MHKEKSAHKVDVITAFYLIRNERRPKNFRPEHYSNPCLRDANILLNQLSYWLGIVRVQSNPLKVEMNVKCL